MKTLHDATKRVLEKLDDPLGLVYPIDQVEVVLKDQYDKLVRKTECLWDQEWYDNIAASGNVVGLWEKEFLTTTSGADFYCGVINYVGHFEKDYLGPVHYNGAIGPCQCTAPFEAQYDYVDDSGTETPPEVFQIPDDFVAMDRVTWDWRMLLSEFAASMRRVYQRFKEHVQGDTTWYTLDSDGLLRMRLIPVPGTSGTRYTYSGYRGILRDDTGDELDDSTYEGTYGILRATDNHLQYGWHRGHPVELHADNANTKIEYLRLGRNIQKGYEFELPDRFVKFVEFGAMAHLLEYEGPGQDLQLSKHYQQRFDEGVAQLRDRVNKVRMERTGSFGGKRAQEGPPPTAQLPWQYGTQIHWTH